MTGAQGGRSSVSGDEVIEVGKGPGAGDLSGYKEDPGVFCKLESVTILFTPLKTHFGFR